jgi:dinuclear metal center YbgI/SA1388 family protein
LELLSNIISVLESWAPPSFQESYDNSGLIVGEAGMKITGAVVCLDSTEEIIDEAIGSGCNLVIAHHPIIFSGIKKLNGKNYVERTLIKAIRNDIAIYALHTNLDNVRHGVNRRIADQLGLTNCKILSPKRGLLKKLVTFCPGSSADQVRNALFTVGAGHIGNYEECSFSVQGTGTFRGNEASSPAVGRKGEQHQEPEERIEVVFEHFRQSKLIKSLIDSHPYEEVAFDIYSIDNEYNNVGSGMIGTLNEPMDFKAFLQHVKLSLKTGTIRYTTPVEGQVSKVAVCGGSGSFLLESAIRSGAHAFITADFKYHQFFDADGRISILDVGHYESEQFTKELIYEFLKEKFTTFALRLSEISTNPIKYF